MDSKYHKKINKLEDCFQNYIDAFNDGSDQIYCSKCKKYMNGTSRIKIIDLPEILVINLARVDGNIYIYIRGIDAYVHGLVFLYIPQ